MKNLTDFIYKEVLTKDFNAEGNYIGIVPSLAGINKSIFKENIIHVIANKNNKSHNLLI